MICTIVTVELTTNGDFAAPGLVVSTIEELLTAGDLVNNVVAQCANEDGEKDCKFIDLLEK
jgi:hypothetical protein